MRIALKIDVSTYRGAREGVPRLAALLARHGVHASFFLAVGPDHSGRAPRRMPGPVGFPALLYGTLLPGPEIGRRCSDTLRAVRDAGHEVGLLAWDAAAWLNRITAADAGWTLAQMERACARFAGIFGEPARAHAAPGWQMSAHAWRLTQRLGFDYSSGTRGTAPYLPVRNAEPVDCPQIPTTLPTLDELIGRDGITPDDVVARLMRDMPPAPAAGHVFTARAEVEGARLLGAFEQLLEAWREAGWSLGTLRTTYGTLDRAGLPRCAVDVGTVAGRSGTLAIQSRPFLA